MSIVFSESFDGPNGATLSTSNTAFTGADNPPVFSTSVKKSGTGSAYYNTTGLYGYMMRTFGATTARYWSFYLYLEAAPSANTPIFFVGTSQADVDRVFQVTLNTNRTVKVQQGSAAIIVGSSTTGALPLNQWSRLDVSYASGAVTCEMYPGDANCDAPVGTATSGDQAGGAITITPVSHLHIGVGNATTNQFYIDEFREATSTLPDPVSVGGSYLYYDTGTEWVDVTSQFYYDNGVSWVQIE